VNGSVLIIKVQFNSNMLCTMEALNGNYRCWRILAYQKSSVTGNRVNVSAQDDITSEMQTDIKARVDFLNPVDSEEVSGRRKAEAL